MRRATAVAAALLATACQSRRHEVRAPEGTGPGPVVSTPPVTEPEEPADQESLGIDWATTPLDSDEDALAVWRRLDLDGDNWMYRLELVPEHATEVMAKALLRQGNFDCGHVDLPMSCSEVEQLMIEPTAADGFDSPCLRRLLALWSIDELDDETLTTELPADLVALAALPPPEHELPRAVLYRVQDQDLLLKMLDAARRAGNPIVDEAVGALSDAGLAEAARLHIDGAVEASDVGTSPDVFIAAMSDVELRSETRAGAIAELAGHAEHLEPRDPERTTIERALVAVASGPDCVLAAGAQSQLLRLDVALPTSGPPKNTARLAWTTCKVMLDENTTPASWRALIDPKGLVVKRHYDNPLSRPPEPDAPDAEEPDYELAPPDEGYDSGIDPTIDPESAPPSWTDVERIPLDADFELPFASELRHALQHCKGNECTVPGTSVRFKLGTRKGSKGRLLIHTLERFERLGDC